MSNKLDNIVKIGEVDFEVQAVTAEKVRNALKVKEIDINNEEHVKDFTGEEVVEVSTVSAETGGYFRMPIGVPPLNDEQHADYSKVNNNQVVNFGDISKITSSLAGSGWYTWELENPEDTVCTFKPVVVGAVNQHVGVVLGLDGHLASFASTNTATEDRTAFLPFYLYICTDTGNLYYGTSDGAYKQIVNKAYEVVSDNNTFTADSINDRFVTIESAIGTLRGEATADGSIAKAVATLKTHVDTEDGKLTGRLDGHDSDIDSLENQFKALLVSDTADKAKKAAAADNSAKLGDIAPDGWQRKIHVRTSDPVSTFGSAGDICIVYK
jgi:hypothetical protein